MSILPDFERLNERLDDQAVKSLLEELGYRFRGKHFSLREERTPSASIRRDGYIRDFGGDFGGDIFDLLTNFHDMDSRQAREWVASHIGFNLSGTDLAAPKARPLPRREDPPRDEAEISKRIEERAGQLLRSKPRPYREKWGESVVEIDGHEVRAVWVNRHFEKLFEGFWHKTEARFAKYLFLKVIGWSDYFRCPAIIVRDESEKVTDIIYYRPSRPDRELPKYLYTSNDKKPKRQPLFPLQAQMMRMALSQKYAIVGEGVKNAIIASLYGVPFLGVWSSGRIEEGFIRLLKSERFSGVALLGGFDGDAAGERAHRKFREAGFDLPNLFSFDSGKDFGEWVKERAKWN